MLKGSDTPADDQCTLFQAQLVFWLIGATDGHAKNFSLFLHPGGGYSLAPLYDVLTAQPSLMARQIDRKQMKLALSVGTHQHYRIDDIAPRHFFQIGDAAGLSKTLIQKALAEIATKMAGALSTLAAELPADFPQDIHDAVTEGFIADCKRWKQGYKRAIPRPPPMIGCHSQPFARQSTRNPRLASIEQIWGYNWGYSANQYHINAI